MQSGSIKVPKLARWRVTLVALVAYCVVGHSSEAPFRGFKETNRLNLEAANLRGQTAASALAAYLDGQGVNQPVAACSWRAYEAMSRPELASGEHLSAEDRWLFSRSATVYPITVPDNGPDLVAQHCTETMAGKMCRTKATPQCARCLECAREQT